MDLSQLGDRLRGRVVVAGVGNRLKGDDGFGPFMIEQLQGKVPAVLFDCGTVPENFLGPIQRQRPDIIVVLDAADFGALPGEITVADSSRWRGGGFSSHSLSLALLADLLKRETGASVYLIAVQAKQVGFGQSMSQEVRQGCRRLQRWFTDSLSPHSWFFTHGSSILDLPAGRFFIMEEDVVPGTGRDEVSFFLFSALLSIIF
jgi:hydrogenase 3 maturation protease